MMISKEHRDYIKLHYHVLHTIRKRYKYIPFRYINRKIKQKWSIIQYNKFMQLYDATTQKSQTIQWSDDI